MPPADIKEDTSEGSEENDSKPLLFQTRLLALETSDLDQVILIGVVDFAGWFSRGQEERHPSSGAHRVRRPWRLE